MNEIYSQREIYYKKRWLTEPIRNACDSHRIVVLTGARQVGKSTLLRFEAPFSEWKYITLDDYDVLEASTQEPSSIWAGADQVVIDEVQKSPQLLEAIKLDHDAQPGLRTFLLSGSANLLLMKGVTESLAGRAVYFTLNPMSIGELNNSPPPKILAELFDGKFPNEKATTFPDDIIPSLLKGFMPPLIQLSSSDAIGRWFEGYVVTYLERDLRQLSQIESLPDFRRLMSAAAIRNATILNQSELARDCRLSQATAHRYLNLLETSFLMIRLPAYASNRTKRLVKSPKIIWLDPGLAAFLAGHYDVSSLESSREAANAFESLVFLHLNVLAQLLIPRPQFFHWRTVAGQEVDFVIEWGRKLIAVEVKLKSSAKFADAEGLRVFLRDHPETSAAALVYAGNEVKRLHEKIIAIPWQILGFGG